MNLRQAAQRALKAMEDGEYRADMIEFSDALIALRAALAEPEQEPVGHADLGINNIYIFSELEPRVVPVGRTPLYTVPTPQSKPQTTHWEGCEAVHPECKATPRKPLTDEEMRECAQAMNAEPLAEGWPELIKFARAIERAHGIGEQT